MASVLVLMMAGLALTFSGCATGLDYERAVQVHNVYRRVLLDVDKEFTPAMVDAEKRIALTNQNLDERYDAEMKPWLAAVTALKTARQTEQAMHASLEQWQAGAQDGAILKSTYACASDAVDKLSLAFGELPDNSVLYAAAFAISTQLRVLADGERCPVR